MNSFFSDVIELQPGESYTDPYFPCAVWSSLLAVWHTRGAWLPPELTDGLIQLLDTVADAVLLDTRNDPGWGSTQQRIRRYINTAVMLDVPTANLDMISRYVGLGPRGTGPGSDALTGVTGLVASNLGVNQGDVQQIAGSIIRHKPDHWVVVGDVQPAGQALRQGINGFVSEEEEGYEPEEEPEERFCAWSCRPGRRTWNR